MIQNEGKAFSEALRSREWCVDDLKWFSVV
jgi:hypothetical protein